MSTPVVAILLILGGAGLVLQNALMLQIRVISNSFWMPLWLNSTVGLVVLSWLVWSQDGRQPVVNLWSEPSWWYFLPGLLGTLFVFASLQGFSHFGASVSVAMLVASQLGAGVAFDAWRGDDITFSSIMGVILLVSGAALVARDV